MYPAFLPGDFLIVLNMRWDIDTSGSAPKQHSRQSVWACVLSLSMLLKAVTLAFNYTYRIKLRLATIKHHDVSTQQSVIGYSPTLNQPLSLQHFVHRTKFILANVLLCGERWSRLRAPDCQSKGRWFNPTYRRFET